MNFESEENNEIYLAPGTNYVLKNAWERHLVDEFKPKVDGLHVFGNHYVTVCGARITVHTAQYVVVTKSGYKEITEPGFEYYYLAR